MLIVAVPILLHLSFILPWIMDWKENAPILIGLLIINTLLAGGACRYLRKHGRFHGITSIAAAGILLSDVTALLHLPTLLWFSFLRQNSHNVASLYKVAPVCDFVAALLKPVVLYLGWRWWKSGKPLWHARTFLLAFAFLIILGSSPFCWCVLTFFGLLSK